MNGAYELEFDEHARQSLDAIPHPLHGWIEQGLQRLAANPVGESKRSTGSRPAGQLFEMEFDLYGADVFVDVIFRYASDEQTLQIAYIFVEIA